MISVDSTPHSLRSDQGGATGQSSSDSSRREARERRRALSRRIRRGLLVVALLAAAGGLVLAVRPQPVPVDVSRVEHGALVVAVEETGTTRVKDRYVVSAPVGGSLSRLSLEPGDSVKEGDAFAEIAPTLAPLLDERTRAESDARLGASLAALERSRAQSARAVAAKELSERELARIRRLAEAGSIAREPLERAEFEVKMRSEDLASATFAIKVAAEEVRLARATLGRGGERSGRDRHIDVVAPVSGSVLSVHRKSAGVIPPGTPLVEIGDSAALEVVVDLLTTDAVHVGPGTRVLIRGWGGDTPLEGRVRLIEPSAFTRPSALGVDEQRVNVVVALTEPRSKWAALGDGYRVEARFVIWQGSDVTKIPQGAVFRHGDRWAVFRIDGGIASVVPVDIGHRGDTDVEVLSGLATGERVIVHPGDRVKEGARVEAR